MANWTKAQLLADLASMYVGVGTPQITPGDPTNGVSKYIVNVVEFGLSQGTLKPTAYRKNVTFYVYNEGVSGQEQAGYELVDPTNTANGNVAFSSSSYQNIANLFNSPVMQQRTLAAIITQCSAVFQESPSYVGPTGVTHAQRMKLINAANQNMQTVVMEFMSAIALNSTVQTAGTAVADSVLLAIISGSWDSYASLIS